MTNYSTDTLIIGSGHAGAQAAMSLRKVGYAGAVTMAGAESVPPYERPPLSKAYLAGEKPFERLLLRPERFWSEQKVELLPERRIVAIDPARHEAVCEDGDRIGYKKLIWAAGGEPRRLTCAGHDFAGLHAIRTCADVDRMKQELASTRQVVVIGGGYIGLEAAAVLTKLGKKVTVLEAQSRVLARVAGEDLSRFYESEHLTHGVEVKTGVTVECVENDGKGRVSGVRLAAGESLPADMVVVGIGIEPAVSPLLDAGAETAACGVLVDAHCRTSLPDVYAVGDCAAHENPYADGAVIRIESVQNANDQAAIAARDIAGETQPYDAVPWFWSDQYDLKLQTVGLSIGYDETLLRGNPEARSFSVVYIKKGRIIALDCVNAARDYVQGRRLVMERASADRKKLADISQPLVEPPNRSR